jgi:predicted lipoprotein with Yx(FWY)xxD motif
MDIKKIIASLIVVGVVFWIFWIVGSTKVSPDILKQVLNVENIPTITDSTIADNTSVVSPVSLAGHPQLGNYLADASGRTLYVTTKTECAGECLAMWPPYVAVEEVLGQDGSLGTKLNESAGNLQYAWNGQFLYYYAQDKKPGDVFGHGVLGVWSLVQQ